MATEFKDVTLRLPVYVVEALDAEVLNARRQGDENVTMSTEVTDAVAGWLGL